MGQLPRKRKPFVPLPGKGMKVRRGLVGDMNSDDGFGWYRFEWQFPKVRTGPMDTFGGLLSDWVRSRHQEARDWLDREVTRYNLTIDEFLSTLSYEVNADGTNEIKADGMPDWSNARRSLPFFSQHNPNAQRMDLVLKELASKVEAIGDNDLIALKVDARWLKKYDFKYIRCRTLILRFHTEDFGELEQVTGKMNELRLDFVSGQNEREDEIADRRKKADRNQKARARYAERKRKKEDAKLKRKIRKLKKWMREPRKAHGISWIKTAKTKRKSTRPSRKKR